MKHIKLFEEFANEANKMAMDYKLKGNDMRNIEVLWSKLSKDKSKSRADIIDEISDTLQINWFEISAWVERNLE